MLTRVVILLNLAVFLAVGVDKLMAIWGKRRIPETNLLVISALGCAPGLWLGMIFFRHKTRKRPFLAWAVLTLVSSVAIYFYAWYRF